MSITVQERLDSRPASIGRSSNIDLAYQVMGTSDDQAAYDAVAAGAPASYRGMVRDTISLEPTERTDLWYATVRYVPPGGQKKDPPETGESSFSFDTGGGTQHITQSLSTSGRYGQSGDSAPNFHGAIGVTSDSVEGCDITVPVYQFSETHYLADAQVNKAAYFALTGKVNNAPFKGCAAGECLFLGASGSKRGTGDWEITFKFAASPNKTNITIGSITVASKKGWEYLWIRYHDVVDDTVNMIVKRPCGAYVEKVYEEGSFSALGIGT
ncbi:MAG: hypothetical protein GXY74_01185 [Phycisphaerae bacterium]|nr:hypothetical protein [Phycisphaerae bacterium]